MSLCIANSVKSSSHPYNGSSSNDDRSLLPKQDAVNDGVDRGLSGAQVHAILILQLPSDLSLSDGIEICIPQDVLNCSVELIV